LTEPVTVVTLVGPWPLALPLFCLALMLFNCETTVVARVMAEYGHHGLRMPDLATVKRQVWLHASALCVILMLSSLSKPFELITSGLFVLFIFRMSLIDTLTGWLPREFTWPFLAAGLCVATGKHVLISHATLSLILLGICWSLRRLGAYFAQREVFGMGDVWLVAGMGAWFGAPVSLLAVMGGLVGFILWYAGSCSQEASRGGPLGPWLGYSALLAMVLNVSDPLLMW